MLMSLWKGWVESGIRTRKNNSSRSYNSINFHHLHLFWKNIYVGFWPSYSGGCKGLSVIDPVRTKKQKTFSLVTRDDSRRRFLAQHSVASLLRHCFELLQHCSIIATLFCAKNLRRESFRVTSPLRWRYTGRFTTTILSATQRCHAIAML